MANYILVLNAGSSSIKFRVFEIAGAELRQTLRGQVEGLYTAPRFTCKDGQGVQVGAREWPQGTVLGHEGAITVLGDFLAERGTRHDLAAVGRK